MSKDKKRLVPVRRFKEFENADAWEQRKLGDVADIVGGGTPSTKVKEYWNGNINWYSPVEIGNSIYASGSVKRITELGLEKSSAKILPKGTVLFTSRAGIGNTAILSKEAATNQGFQSIVPKKKLLDSYFIFTETPFLKKYGEINGAGSTFVEVSGKQMAKMPLRLPLLEEQKKIGVFFKQIDSLIALHQRKLDKLKRVKSAYLTEMFPAEGEREPKRRFPGFTGAWEQRKLGEVVEITMGQSPSSKNYTENPNDHILVQGNADMKNGYVVPRVWTTQITKQAEKGDLILSVRAPVGDIGKTDYDVVLGRGVAAIKGNSFIFQLLTKMKINGYWTRFSTGSTFESINSDNIKNAQISIPSLREQEKIGGLFNEFDSLIALHQRKLDKLQKLKNAYLNEMFV
ncbi:restriction endonuclease subunit S [Lactobacillus johnsonii]|uniref:restriction endonuclease subunit S n=1 Tax=Lactobacillus johnsonii TaxID=33959 RepID=UPI001FB503F1|nr:restriction endonuclease subunit S [Lactobacillus johnsonii]UOC05923.1 restriction endonuclease subunit S [Lactobacillus johnsonii]